MSSGYRKFSSRFVGDGDTPKTFATFATFTDGRRVFEPYPDPDKTTSGHAKIQSTSVKVAKVAKVEAQEAIATSVRPDGVCKLALAEFPAAGGRYRKAFAFLLVKPPAYISVERWQQAVEDGRSFLAHGANRPKCSTGIRATYSVSTPHRLTLIRPIHGFLDTTTPDCAGCCRAKR